MNSVGLYLVLALAVLVLGAGVTVALLRGRRRTPIAPSAPTPSITKSRPGTVDDPTLAVPTLDTAPGGEAPAEAAALEAPEPTAGRLIRLRARLARSNTAVGKGLLSLLTRSTLDAATWDEVEETLLSSDLGVGPTQELLATLKLRTKVDGVADLAGARALLREELLALVDPTLDRSLATHTDADRPAIVLVVGVNGTGKTTTTGKLARVLVADGRSVVLGAADTFRAAASQQLQTWGDRVGARVVTGPEAGDPAAVAYDAVRVGIEIGADVVVIDTAARSSASWRSRLLLTRFSSYSMRPRVRTACDRRRSSPRSST